MKINQRKWVKVIYSELLWQRGHLPSLCYDRDSKANRGVGKFYGGKRGGSMWTQIGGCCCKEAVVQWLTRSRVSYVMG